MAHLQHCSPCKVCSNGCVNCSKRGFYSQKKCTWRQHDAECREMHWQWRSHHTHPSNTTPGACAQPRKMLNNTIKLTTEEMSDVAVYYSCDVAPGLVAAPAAVKVRGVIAYEPVPDCTWGFCVFVQGKDCVLHVLLAFLNEERSMIQKTDCHPFNHTQCCLWTHLQSQRVVL